MPVPASKRMYSSGSSQASWISKQVVFPPKAPVTANGSSSRKFSRDSSQSRSRPRAASSARLTFLRTMGAVSDVGSDPLVPQKYSFISNISFCWDKAIDRRGFLQLKIGDKFVDFLLETVGKTPLY